MSDVDEQQRRVRFYVTLFIIVGIVMVAVGVLDLLINPADALLAWVIIACGVFNIGIAILFHRRN